MEHGAVDDPGGSGRPPSPPGFSTAASRSTPLRSDPPPCTLPGRHALPVARLRFSGGPRSTSRPRITGDGWRATLRDTARRRGASGGRRPGPRARFDRRATCGFPGGWTPEGEPYCGGAGAGGCGGGSTHGSAAACADSAVDAERARTPGRGRVDLGDAGPPPSSAGSSYAAPGMSLACVTVGDRPFSPGAGASHVVHRTALHLLPPGRLRAREVFSPLGAGGRRCCAYDAMLPNSCAPYSRSEGFAHFPVVFYGEGAYRADRLTPP